MAKMNRIFVVSVPSVYFVRLEGDWAYVGSNVIHGKVPSVIALDFIQGQVSVETVLDVAFENAYLVSLDRDYLRSFEDDEEAYEALEASCEEQRLHNLLEYYGGDGKQ